jgi:hypothetical protein
MVRSSRPSPLPFAFALVALVAASGCGILPTSGGGRERAVQSAAVAFNDNLRWGRIDQAATFVHPEARADFLERGGELRERVRVTELELTAVEFGPKIHEATATVMIQLYRLPSIEAVTLVERQRWTYSARHTTWFVHPDVARLLGDEVSRARR